MATASSQVVGLALTKIGRRGCCRLLHRGLYHLEEGGILAFSLRGIVSGKVDRLGIPELAETKAMVDERGRFPWTRNPEYHLPPLAQTVPGFRSGPSRHSHLRRRPHRLPRPCCPCRKGNGATAASRSLRQSSWAAQSSARRRGTVSVPRPATAVGVALYAARPLAPRRDLTAWV